MRLNDRYLRNVIWYRERKKKKCKPTKNIFNALTYIGMFGCIILSRIIFYENEWFLYELQLSRRIIDN